MSLLITPSLISSIDFHMSCPSSWKDQSYTDIVNMLSRNKEKEIPEIIQKGIVYENLVYKNLAETLEKCACTDTNHNGFEDIQCKNIHLTKEKVEYILLQTPFIVQKKSKSYLHIDLYRMVCLFGKIDIYSKNVIIDLKLTEKFDEQKYRQSIQHHIYCFNEKVSKFVYIVYSLSDQKIHTVFLDIDITKSEEIIRDKITQVLNFIEKDTKLKELYHTKFCLY